MPAIQMLSHVRLATAATLLLGSLQVAQAQKLHAVLVGDTDSNLSDGVIENLRKMDYLLKSIKQLGKIDVAKIELTGGKFTCTNIRKAVRSLRLKDKDTVVFYYAGHGSRGQNAPTKFPEFDCAESASGAQLDLSTVVRMLTEKKKPNFVLAIADACNVTRLGEEGAAAAAPPVPPEQRALGLRRLFMGYEGTLIMSAARPSEYAWYMTEGDLLGGFFTNQLASAIDAGIAKADSARWEDVAVDATKQIDVPNEGGPAIKQNPQFEAIGLKRR